MTSRLGLLFGSHKTDIPLVHLSVHPSRFTFVSPKSVTNNMSAEPSEEKQMQYKDECHEVADVECKKDDVIRHAEISEMTVVAEGEERTTWFVWLLVMCCSISGLLFGRTTTYLFVTILTIFFVISRL